MKRVLVAVAHPDDEVLLCGGSIAKHVEAGDFVSVIFVSDGESWTAEPSKLKAEMTTRKREAGMALRVLGVEQAWFLDAPDQRLSKLSRWIKPFEAAVERFRFPDVVYTHRLGDLNADHRAVAEAVLVKFRPYGSFVVGRAVKILGGEVDPMSVGLDKPTVFNVLDSRHLDKKRSALACYSSQVVPEVHPRSNSSVMSLVRMRGAHAGTQFAEAFELLLEVM